MSELTDRGANRAVAIALQRDNAALRQEIERLTARHTELEQAMRLHLAVSPDDPVLLTPVERRCVQAEQERDAFIRGGVTEELLRKNDGYLKVGKGCVLVREDDWQQAQQALSQLSTDLTDQSEAVHKKEPSGSPD